MADFEELSLNEMEMVTGGVLKPVNTGTDQNAAIKNGPGNGAVIDSLPNGTMVDTIGTPVFDQATGRNWIQVTYKNKKGKNATGWIAASIVGMKR